MKLQDHNLKLIGKQNKISMYLSKRDVACESVIYLHIANYSDDQYIEKDLIFHLYTCTHD